MTIEEIPNQEEEEHDEEMMQVDEEPVAVVEEVDETNEGGTEEDLVEKEKKNPLYLDENLLPASVVMKIAKGTLGEGAAINKEAKEALIRCCTVFVNYLTATASVHSDPKSKTIGVEHIYRALAVLELDQSILKHVQTAVNTHSSIAKQKRDEYRKRVKEQKQQKEGASATTEKPNDEGASMNVDQQEEDSSVVIPQKRAGEDLSKETSVENSSFIPASVVDE